MSDFVKYVCRLPSVPLGTTGKTMKRGDIVEFNGADIRIGAEVFRLPQLQSAIRQGWFVESTESKDSVNPSQQPEKAIRQVRDAEVDWENPNKRSEIAVEQFYAEEREVGQVVESNERDPQTQSAFQTNHEREEEARPGELNLSFNRKNVEILSDNAPSIGTVQAPAAKEAAVVEGTTATTNVVPPVDGNRLEPTRELAPVREQFVVEK